MALLDTTLAANLKSLELYDEELPAINAWAGAFADYFKLAQSNAVPILPAAVDAAELAFIGACTGLSTNGATALKTALLAFWNVFVLAPAAAWATVTAIVIPTTIAQLDAEPPNPLSLKTVFQANINGELTKEASMDAIAGILHGASLGGTAAWPTPILVQPIL